MSNRKKELKRLLKAREKSQDKQFVMDTYAYESELKKPNISFDKSLYSAIQKKDKNLIKQIENDVKQGKIVRIM
jgi:hypothetical protein